MQTPIEKSNPRGGLAIFVELLPLIGLFWLFVYLRLYNIGGWIGYFIDEVQHMRRARIVLTFSDLQVSTTPGKFLLYYYLALFDLPLHQPAWLARTAVAIFSLLGVAGTFALGKILFSRRAGLIAVVIVIFFPFLAFHERMVLTDPIASVFAVLAAWWSVALVRRPTRQKATLLGVFLCLMLMAKILSVVLVAIPVLAVLLLKPEPFKFNVPLFRQAWEIWRTYRPFALRTAAVVGAVWSVILLFYLVRGILDPIDTGPIVDEYIYAGLAKDLGSDRTYAVSTLDVVELNLEHSIEVFRYLFGVGLTGLLVVAGIILAWRAPRKLFYFVVPVLLLWLAVSVTAARPNSRYFTLVGQIFAVLIAGGIVTVQGEIQRVVKTVPGKLLAYLPLLTLAVWLGNFGIPFTRDMLNDSTQLELPEYELQGYYRNRTGFALTPAMNRLIGSPPISEGADEPVIYGLIRTCEFIDYYVPDKPYRIYCHEPTIDFGNEEFNALLQRYHRMYVIQEDAPLLDVDKRSFQGRMQWLATYERPHNGVKVRLYIASAAGLPSGGYRPSPDIMDSE